TPLTITRLIHPTQIFAEHHPQKQEMISNSGRTEQPRLHPDSIHEKRSPVSGHNSPDPTPTTRYEMVEQGTCNKHSPRLGQCQSFHFIRGVRGEKQCEYRRF